MSPPNPASPVYAELLDLLHQAVTIEQALMLQYLYAAFPLKKKYEALRGQGWLSEHYDLLGITIEEMRHLHLVSLLLARLKQSPQLKPLAFPFELKRYGLKMDLHWLDSQRLAQYVFVEARAEDVDRRKADNPNDPDRDFILRLYQYFPKEGTLESLGSLYTAIIDKLDELKNNLPDGLRYLAPELPDWAVRLEGIKGNGVGAHFKFMRSLFMGTHPLLATKDKSIIWDTAAPESNDYPSLVVTRPPGSSKDYHAELNNLSAAQRLVLLANLHYWIVLGLLNMTYRHDDWSDPDPLEPPRYLALAQRHMRGPVLLLGLRLAEQEIGFPFDEFPEAFDWENQDHARSVIRQLVAKASLVAHKLMETGQLINSFKLHIYPITLSALV